VFKICCCLFTLVARAHSFSQQILPNSAGQFAKFCGSPRQSCLSSMAYCGRPFVNKLSSVLCINFSYWRLALCSVMLATFKENYQFFFFSKVQSVKLNCAYLLLCAVLRWRLTVLGRLVWSFPWYFYFLFSYVVKPTIVLIIGHFSISAKFC